MKYAMQFWFENGVINHNLACSAKERDEWINEARKYDINAVTYNPIYKSGEYGKRTCVIFNRG